MAILIVDDDSGLGRLVSLRLGAEGYETLTARNAKDAFRVLGGDGEASDVEIDLVLLDVFLPDVSGIEVCQKIKSDPRTCDIPVIMMTGSDDEMHLQQAFDAGAVDYIEKPFKGMEMLARIRSALRLKREIESRKRQAIELEKVAEQLKKANERLRQLSFHDSLTGLHNRRYFDKFLEREFKRAQRNKNPIALIMIDIDYFKKYNDRFGHQAGDECLRQIAATFALVVHRSHDLVARYGGEEFAVVLPETDMEGVLAVAENLRGRVADLRIHHPESPYGHVTISEGATSVIPAPESCVYQLIEAADSALYRSKRAGRNRVSAVP